MQVWRFPSSGAAGLILLGAWLAGCSYMPDVSQFKLPDANTFIPTDATEFNRASLNTSRPVRAEDLVDGQGRCSGMAAADAQANTGEPVARGISLDMTECDVVRALGPPQVANVGRNERGDREVVMTFPTGDRAGVYRFVAGRLTAMERAAGAEAAETPAKKPPPKRQAKRP